MSTIRNFSLFLAYACHGSWEEDGVSYVITTPLTSTKKSTHQDTTLRHCFIFQLSDKPEEAIIEGGLGKSSGPPILRISKISESCHRDVVPGIDGNMAFNFTSNGNLSFALNFAI